MNKKIYITAFSIVFIVIFSQFFLVYKFFNKKGTEIKKETIDILSGSIDNFIETTKYDLVINKNFSFGTNKKRYFEYKFENQRHIIKIKANPRQFDAYANKAAYDIICLYEKKYQKRFSELDTIYKTKQKKSEKKFGHILQIYNGNKNDSLVFSSENKTPKRYYIEYSFNKKLGFESDFHYKVFLNPFEIYKQEIFLASTIFILLIGFILFAIYFIKMIIEVSRNATVQTNAIAHLNHEIIKPVQTIIGLTEKTIYDKEPENYIPALDVSNKYLKKLFFIIQSMLTSWTNKTFYIQYEEFNLREEINAIVDMIFINMAKDNISIDINENVNIIKTDKNILKQILSNLIDNARKYADTGKPVQKIDIKAWSEDKKTYISIKDNGTGISKRGLKKIFNKFYREPSASSKTGFGLGLTFVKRATKALAGDIKVNSIIGKGSEFIIILPDI